MREGFGGEVFILLMRICVEIKEKIVVGRLARLSRSR